MQLMISGSKSKNTRYWFGPVLRIIATIARQSLKPLSGVTLPKVIRTSQHVTTGMTNMLWLPPFAALQRQQLLSMLQAGCERINLSEQRCITGEVKAFAIARANCVVRSMCAFKLSYAKRIGFMTQYRACDNTHAQFYMLLSVHLLEATERVMTLT